MTQTDQTIFKGKKGISFENLWKNWLTRELGKWKHGQFKYILGFNLAIFDIVLIGGALNRNHLTLCVLNFGIRLRWIAPEYRAVPMPKPKKKVTLRTVKKRKE